MSNDRIIQKQGGASDIPSRKRIDRDVMLLGEILMNKHDIAPMDIEKALQFQSKFGGLLGSILVNMGIIDEEILVSALSDQLGLKTYQNIDRDKPDFKKGEIGEQFNLDFFMERYWLYFGEKNGKVLFAAVRPLDYEIVQYLRDQAVDWEVCLVTEAQFRELQAEYQMTRETDKAAALDISDMMGSEIDQLRELASEAPIVNLVNSFVSRAVSKGASDLHFEPYGNMYRVRFRIDGILHDIDFLPLKMQLPVASRIKILAGMDIAERRRPQDGQISMKISSKEIDIRVSTLPLHSGESLVLRFLLKESISYDLDSLGLEPDLIRFLEEDISKSSGVILLTGPTGSGKTTTLYSCLNKINSEDKKLITIENPVEYHLGGLNQIQVNPEIGYDFVQALRTILRQDPDVIMLGEIRDGETARVAMQSSLTGHLVLSTVHTNDAPTAYMRLIDLGVDEYLINASLISLIAQRLVRKVCPDCAIPLALDDPAVAAYDLGALARKHGIKDVHVKQAKGCPLCNQTGYRGRLSIMEYLRCTSEVKNMAKNAVFLQEIRKFMSANNIRSLGEDGLLKVIHGQTTVEEVLRVSG